MGRPAETENTFRMWEYLNRDNALGNGRSVATGWGSSTVAVFLAVAWLNDTGQCATVDPISRLSGQSASPTHDRLRVAVCHALSPIVRLAPVKGQCPCGNARAHHYSVAL
jgi:hypothetical protein